MEKIKIIAEPKGLFGADLDDDLYPIRIKAILQNLHTGEILVDTRYGLIGFTFDFVGSKKELRKFSKEMSKR